MLDGRFLHINRFVWEGKMDKIFYPASVVLVGVSEKADNLAQSIANNFVSYGYRGETF